MSELWVKVLVVVVGSVSGLTTVVHAGRRSAAANALIASEMVFMMGFICGVVGAFMHNSIASAGGYSP